MKRDQNFINFIILSFFEKTGDISQLLIKNIINPV